MKNLVSIVTPYYNSGEFFKKTLDSVLNQTYKNWEWIIIDDCSNEEESNSLDDLSLKDKRIRIIHNNIQSGAAYSRNIGIQNASGEFIAFLDSDDFWAYDKLEKQIAFMLENNYDFTSTFYKVFDEEKDRIIFNIKGPKKCNHKKFVRLDYVGCLTVVYKRSIAPDLAIPTNLKKRNDYALWLKLSEHATCYMLPEYLATYVRHKKNSISSGSKFQLIKYHRDVFIGLYNYSKFKATLFALRNVFFYVLKELFHKRKVKK